MKSFIKTTLVASTIMTALSLTACGGSGGDSKEAPVAVVPPVVVTPPAAKTMTFSGNVIDGYVVGAKVFMDLNFNGLHDEGEPFGTTVDAVPNYTLEVPEDCGQYVPMVTHVPVGAIDLDFPDTPITEEYYMTTAPSFLLKTDETMQHVTPLTTLIWSEIETELSMEGEVLSCQSIIDNQRLRESIEARLAEQELRVATRYNITVDSLYSDYVASGDTELHGLAQSLVPGLVKSYADTVSLEEARPDASIAFVEYFFKDAPSISSETWSRREYIQTSPGNFDDIVNAMTSGLTTTGGIETAIKQRTSSSNGITLKVETTYEYGLCGETEKFSEINGTTGYSLTNVASMPDSTWSACQSIDNVAFNIAQTQGTDVYFSASALDSRAAYSEHTFYTDNAELRVELIGATTADFSDGWLSDNLSGYSLSFEDNADMGADFWFRGKSEFPTGGSVAQILSSHNSEDEYTVTTINVDGTRSKQCGTWSGGAGSLTNCN